jgi:hypothetical protein
MVEQKQLSVNGKQANQHHRHPNQRVSIRPQKLLLPVQELNFQLPECDWAGLHEIKVHGTYLVVVDTF